MTAHKHRKQRVRRRAERTGESYTAALRYLRPPMTEEKLDRASWRRIEKPDFGYAISIPEGWIETPPDLRNSPWETARFGTPEDRRHDVVVFRQPVISGQTAADIVANAKSHLEGYGFGDFHVEHVTVASREGFAPRLRHHRRREELVEPAVLRRGRRRLFLCWLRIDGPRRDQGDHRCHGG